MPDISLSATNLQDNDLDPDALELAIRLLVNAYQRTRTRDLARSIVRYSQALCHHPEYEGTDEDRCAWHRLSRHWDWLAGAGNNGRTGDFAGGAV